MNRFILALAAFAIASPAFAEPLAPLHDGVHDFDFAVGRFHTHIRRAPDPFGEPNKWVTYDGIKTTRKILDGYGDLETIEADGPSHLQVLNLFFYDKTTHQWNLYFPQGEDVGAPAIGEFHDGVGTFMGQDTYKGRTMLVRQQWTPKGPDSYHFEQSFSADFGKTWVSNFVADLVRT
ncbi:MAG TPA: hypothetical protein VHW69_10570 [Rhizomicrobium sp.]|jgi:hypothetical protein|nr:hypothetical protein [Rhizomicrobium sp.]